MNNELKNSGFSLVEVLLAVGTLAIGMIFIGGTFLVGIHFTTVSTERTTASIAAGEAFAKVQLYGVHPADANCVVDGLTPFEMLEHGFLPGPFAPVPIDPNEFAYPSTRTLADKQYFWSALCRRLAPAPDRFVQVTVFVSRKIGAAAKYEGPLGPAGPPVNWPIPVQVGVTGTPGALTLAIESGREHCINDGYTIVENSRGDIYRVVERDPDRPDTIILDRSWDPDGVYPNPDSVWVVPPPITGGRGPCIAVYQTVIRF